MRRTSSRPQHLTRALIQNESMAERPGIMHQLVCLLHRCPIVRVRQGCQGGDRHEPAEPVRDAVGRAG
eukprot:8011959-Heterocapsa_arctica.AAC.1